MQQTALMNIPSATVRNLSCYQLQTKLLHFYSSYFNQIGSLISDQLEIDATYFSIKHRNKVLN